MYIELQLKWNLVHGTCICTEKLITTSILCSLHIEEDILVFIYVPSAEYVEKNGLPAGYDHGL